MPLVQAQSRPKIQTQPQRCVLADPDNVAGSAVNDIRSASETHSTILPELSHTPTGWLDGGKSGKFWAGDADGEPAWGIEMRMEGHQTHRSPASKLRSKST